MSFQLLVIIESENEFANSVPNKKILNFFDFQFYKEKKHVYESSKYDSPDKVINAHTIDDLWYIFLYTREQRKN